MKVSKFWVLIYGLIVGFLGFFIFVFGATFLQSHYVNGVVAFVSIIILALWVILPLLLIKDRVNKLGEPLKFLILKSLLYLITAFLGVCLAWNCLLFYLNHFSHVDYDRYDNSGFKCNDPGIRCNE